MGETIPFQRKPIRQALFLAVLAIAVAVDTPAASFLPSASSHRAGSGPVVPRDPIATIFEAFGSYQLVALGEEHGDEQGHAFRLSLVRDPRFAAAVNDVVVEFGNARYQNLIDRFVQGENVSTDALRHVWQNTTMPHAVWDRPIYEEFYRAVREVNASPSSHKQLRVLLGDPPIDWDAVSTAADVQRWQAIRDQHAADIIRTEVLAKHRRALVIYGPGHLWRSGFSRSSLVNLLDRPVSTELGGRVFTIFTNAVADLNVLDADTSSWPVPSIVLTAGTPFERQLDAVLYLGPLTDRTISRLPLSLCSDATYVSMRTRRLRLAPAFGDPSEFIKMCEAADRK